MLSPDSSHHPSHTVNNALADIPIQDLLHLRMPEEQARHWLLQLTPEQVSPALFRQFVNAITETGLPIPPIQQSVMDCCGTGGSGISHYNTSSTVSFVLASAGVPVVKFGNRAISSQSGSFDFLEGLGFPPHTVLERVPDILNACGLVFLYAPQCYPLLQPFNALRRRLGVCTIFNYLGPLLNPVQPAYRLLGVSHSFMQAVLANHLADSSPTLKKAWVVHAPQPQTEDPAIGLDEIASHGRTRVWEVQPNTCRDIPIDRPPATTIVPPVLHSAALNVEIFKSLIAGEDTESAYYRMVCLNAGAGLHVAGKASGLAEGILLAQDLLAGGKVRETFQQCRRAYDDLNR